LDDIRNTREEDGKGTAGHYQGEGGRGGGGIRGRVVEGEEAAAEAVAVAAAAWVELRFGGCSSGMLAPSILLPITRY